MTPKYESSELSAVHIATVQTIRRLMGALGVPPTLAEIGDELGVSKGSIGSRIDILQREGFITRRPGKSRSILLTPKSEAIPREAVA